MKFYFQLIVNQIQICEKKKIKLKIQKKKNALKTYDGGVAVTDGVAVVTGTVLGISVWLNETFLGTESFNTFSNEKSDFFSPKERPEATGTVEASFKTFPNEKLLEVLVGSDKFFLISVGVNVVAEADEKIDGLVGSSFPLPPNDKLKPLLTGVEIGFCSAVLIGVIVILDGRPAKTELPDPVPAKENDLVSGSGFCCWVELWLELTLKFCAENGEFVANGLLLAVFSLFSIFWRTFSFNFSLTISSVFGFSVTFGAANENDFVGSDVTVLDNGFCCENPKLSGGFDVGFGCGTKSGVFGVGVGAGLNWNDFVVCSGFLMLKLVLSVIGTIGAEIVKVLKNIIFFLNY